MDLSPEDPSLASGPARLFLRTPNGRMMQGNSTDYLAAQPDGSLDLIITSPPFGLIAEKEYGNVPADDYLDWFKPFAEQFHRLLKDSGSLVLDLGGAWSKGLPTRHLYHFELLILLCKEYGFHLAQDFYWWNPAKLPSPAEWVTVRRVRVKDSINTVWWLSKTPWPKASNRRVLQPYSARMKQLFKVGYNAGPRPSGHNISGIFDTDHGGAIPPNLLAISNTESNSAYLRYCKDKGLKPHPARFPAELPEFFIRMLTDQNDCVLDPFGGSCVTGEVCERLGRRWTCVELRQDYLEAAMGRFVRKNGHYILAPQADGGRKVPYEIWRPGALWSFNEEGEPLPADGGRSKAKLFAKVKSQLTPRRQGLPQGQRDRLA